MALHQFALGRAERELMSNDANRDASTAIEARWPIGDTLATTESDTPQGVVEFDGMGTGELGKDLTLGPTWKVRARARGGHKKAGEAKGCSHD
jgi:hypothetical protein